MDFITQSRRNFLSVGAVKTLFAFTSNEAFSAQKFMKAKKELPRM